ncbi:MAG: hypothetical protein E6422_02775 [Veillonella sp.]|uniref:hypothetical protein n=1 Tax=Veillonella sp. TaxID=1926307 RepID=UPI00290FB2D1|nr:hypothetical protein [Veillonella sp.]MDU6787072.1 hypothetical protein [Veillonella sp.]
MSFSTIIHSRTFHCDFISDFIVRPESFLATDIKFFRKYILQATENIDILNGFRWVIIDNEHYRIAGIVGFIKDMILESNLNQSELDELKLFAYDDKGRATYAFIGEAISKSNYKYTEINIDSLLREYIKFIRPKWMSATIQSTLSTVYAIPDYADILKKSKPLIDSINLIDKDIYEANNKFDYELFQYFLNNELLENFSFCSNLENYNTIKNCDFSTLTTSNNNIVRLKRDKSNTHINANANSNILSDKSVTDIKQKKKNTKTLILPIISIILLLIILKVIFF